ncbi:hypothetical protein Deipr_1489 [Deinococcus proteolyticus MRP]|uniref:Uncharacterized protein n=1 Tax=Deinococcus proteolyticus (strain ATCC 35074 / DSM 20540 / JCM 6276 / NBRC 101906 / NCIMB 13154 / VKM Ac-1939 / CCM 2703 / MRP) TaxID=693977 RepID=F0RJY2_DEIPM|nr:hypothetical protein Deipr_1489 [Deinococcus proteolyticus MRP]
MLPADPTTHPTTYQYQLRHGTEYAPDPLYDTTSKRRRRATRLWGDGQGVSARLFLLPGKLHHLIVDIEGCDDFYWDGPRLAQQQLQAILGNAPRYVTVARSRKGKVHAHVVVALGLEDPKQLRKAGCWLTPVKGARGLERLMAYLSKPRDERACRPDKSDVLNYSAEELEQQRLDACELLLAARAKGRLPRGSFTTHLPRLKPDLPTPLPATDGTSSPSSLPTVIPALALVAQRECRSALPVHVMPMPVSSPPRPGAQAVLKPLAFSHEALARAPPQLCRAS